MSSENRFLPNSEHTRITALNIAKRMSDNPAIINPLTTKTKDRLNAIQPLLESAIRDRTVKTAALAGLIEQKEKAREKAAMFCSHFVQVMNLCITRGEYVAAIRALYGLPIENDKIYSLITEYDITHACRQLLQGETQRVAQGGVPMSRPSAAEVKLHYDVYHALIQSTSNAKMELRDAQKAVAVLQPEVRKVIRKVWAEVKTHYNELPRPGQRDHMRLWGVTFGRKGHLKKITGTVTDAATGLPLAGAQLKLASGRNKMTSNGIGKFVITTTLMHGQTLTATLTGYQPYKTTVLLQEGETTECEVKMVLL
jgi:hypothetical protein